MERLAVRDHREIWFHELGEEDAFMSPFAGTPFVAAVMAAPSGWPAAKRRRVVEQLFASGCRYGVFACADLHAWDMDMDMVCIESDADFQPSDENFVMTTTHEDFEDAVFFALNCTGEHQGELFRKFLFLAVGNAHPEVRRNLLSIVTP